jgi:hypothetical protein
MLIHDHADPDFAISEPHVNGVSKLAIGIKEDCIEHYRALHDGPGVRDGKTGQRTPQHSLAEAKDAMQLPFKTEKGWTVMERIFFNS